MEGALSESNNDNSNNVGTRKRVSASADYVFASLQRQRQQQQQATYSTGFATSWVKVDEMTTMRRTRQCFRNAIFNLRCYSKLFKNMNKCYEAVKQTKTENPKSDLYSYRYIYHSDSEIEH